MAFDKIPVIVVLWEHPYFRGRRILLNEDTQDLGNFGFHDLASSIGIHPGPDYDPATHSQFKVSFFEHTNYQGAQLVLTPGAYPDLRRSYNFNDIISSVNFSHGVPPAPKISPIPVVAELFEHDNYRGKKLLVLEDISNIHTYADFGDKVTSVKVYKGPDYANSKKCRLFRNSGFNGGQIDLVPGNYPNLGSSHGFNDVVSSVKIR